MSYENESPAVEGELIEAASASINAALTQITKAEIDQQIATAHAWPRSVAKFKARAIEMATLDEETAESCIYSRPVGKDPKTGKTTFAEGLSVRTAEIVGACYGNLRVGAMLIEITPRYVKARGFAHDLETNFASTSEVIEATVDKNGRPYSERMRVVVAKAALAKARRDATFCVVPRALCKPIETAARQAAIGDATTLDKRRARAMAWVNQLGIDPARVFTALGVSGADDLTIDLLTTITGIRTAVKDGESSIDEAFPPLVDGTPTPAAAAAAKAAEKARGKQKGAARYPSPPPADAPVDIATGEVLNRPEKPRGDASPSLDDLMLDVSQAQTADDLDFVRSNASGLGDGGRATLSKAIAARFSAMQKEERF